jgi:hypothetical protein
LTFHNYTVVPPPTVLPSVPCSKKSSADEFIKNSLNTAHTEDLNELRQQLQLMKKQALLLMEQSRKSSEKEKLAIQQAQEAMVLKETAVAEAAQAASQENCMLDLMIEASQDIAGMFLNPVLPLFLFLFPIFDSYAATK